MEKPKLLKMFHQQDRKETFELGQWETNSETPRAFLNYVRHVLEPNAFNYIGYEIHRKSRHVPHWMFKFRALESLYHGEILRIL